ncbi:uncharacterized protein LOC105173966 [Sesamum indicum]|uniref:Uncharacterized protein LOC105173966 n=1 Tax=Sesamum indicum TaxID=4182 RepID=A0A6I9U903_SESIN|nr:uncharacterized protein LOC105173966 [Sesamum indicum]
MDSSSKTCLMAVLAASGSVVFLAMQAHNRLLSNFINQMEFQINASSTGAAAVREDPKKKVRFAADVADKGSGRRAAAGRRNGESLEAMPRNWQAMYKGILQQRNLRGYM